MSDYDKDIQRVIKRAQEQGWTHRMTEKNHHQLYSPDKTTIVTAAGTPSDYRSWDNFMADMRRGGYMNGATIGEATTKAPAIAEHAPTARITTAAFVREILQAHPRGLSRQDIFIRVKATIPTATEPAVANALLGGRIKGMFENPERGFWRLATHRDAPPPPAVGRLEPVEHAAGVSSGDPQIDEDIKQLDAALAALGAIESVVRRNREVLHQFAKLKAMLGVK